MKKIVPFEKDLMFKTKIGEITSIALDNTLKLNSDFVSGEFIVSGTYKLQEESQIEEEFKYNIPVDITIDSKYDTKNCQVSIDDFSYEIINEEKLKVNISVMLDDLDIKEDPIETIEVEAKADERDFDFDLIDIDANINTEVNPKVETHVDTNNIENSKDIDIENKHEYSIYRVYTVKEEDSVDIICDKFQTTKDILTEYNDLDNIGIGSKIIIPSKDE